MHCGWLYRAFYSNYVLPKIRKTHTVVDNEHHTTVLNYALYESIENNILNGFMSLNI